MGQQKINMVYVAAPYWHEDETVRNYRRRKAIEYSEMLFRKGVPFYSPLMYSERFAKNKAKEGYWIQHGLRMVDICDEMRVLCLEGWEDSGGVKGEMARAEALGVPVKMIERHVRLSFHGSRDLSREQCKPAILAEFEKHQPDVIITHGEPEGACAFARRLAREQGLSLKLHHLQHWRLAGQFHWRSTAVLEDSEYAIFLHDGKSQGTANELELAQKMGIPFTYYRLRDGVLVVDKTAQEDVQDFSVNLDLLADNFEKNLDESSRKTPEYQRFRKAVLERDGWACQFCGAKELLHVHHIVPYSKISTLSLDVSNGQTLCATCHGRIHGKVRSKRSG